MLWLTLGNTAGILKTHTTQILPLRIFPRLQGQACISMWFYSQPFEKLCSPACHAARGKEEAKNVQNYVLLPVMQHITRRKRKMCKTMFSCVPCST